MRNRLKKTMTPMERVLQVIIVVYYIIAIIRSVYR